MKHIPKLLIYSRLAVGLLIIILSLLQVPRYNMVVVILFSIGLLTDIFDGIIARRLGISSQHLRRLDSAIDQVFFVLVALATFIECPSFFYNNAVKLIVLLGAEGLAYLVCFLKFRKEVATHAISSKIWTLVLFATLVQIMTTCHSGLLFEICFYAGIATRLEIIGIILILREWTNDVPSIYHAFLLRKGKPVKRHKLFNG
ncbi:MAG TPA: CDP-alcohol phosphatidyltransferase family protein [Chitinophagaceae bacterium]